jgi:hypothetical protein
LSEFGDSLPDVETKFKDNNSRKSKGINDPDEGTSKYVSIYDEEMR